MLLSVVLSATLEAPALRDPIMRQSILSALHHPLEFVINVKGFLMESRLQLC